MYRCSMQYVRMKARSHGLWPSIILASCHQLMSRQHPWELYPSNHYLKLDQMSRRSPECERKLDAGWLMQVLIPIHFTGEAAGGLNIDVIQLSSGTKYVCNIPVNDHNLSIYSPLSEDTNYIWIMVQTQIGYVHNTLIQTPSPAGTHALNT